MLEILGRGLGFVSASLVALIALGFGAMFLFFSGSAALILGHFLRFVTSPRTGLPAVVLSSAAGGALGLAPPAPGLWGPASAQPGAAPAPRAGVGGVDWLPAPRPPPALGVGGGV